MFARGENTTSPPMRTFAGAPSPMSSGDRPKRAQLQPSAWRMASELARATQRRVRAYHLRLAPHHFLRRMGPSSSELGLAGECLAARALIRRGARLRARRLKTVWGELDLCMDWDSGPALVEVKSGRVADLDRDLDNGGGTRWRPADRFGRRQFERLRAAAAGLEVVLRCRPRIDLVEVALGPDFRALRITWWPQIDARAPWAPHTLNAGVRIHSGLRAGR